MNLNQFVKWVTEESLSILLFDIGSMACFIVVMAVLAFCKRRINKLCLIIYIISIAALVVSGVALFSEAVFKATNRILMGWTTFISFSCVWLCSIAIILVELFIAGVFRRRSSKALNSGLE